MASSGGPIAGYALARSTLVLGRIAGRLAVYIRLVAILGAILLLRLLLFCTA